MRILVCADAVGGVFTYALTLGAGLRRRGHEIALALHGPPPDDEQRARMAATGFAAVHESDLPLEWQDRAGPDQARVVQWLRELVADHRPDLLHLGDFVAGGEPWPVPTVLVAHSDVTTWWRSVHATDPPAEWAPYRAAVGAGLAGVSAVVAPSGAMRDALRRAYGARADRVRVIHNGVPAADDDAAGAAGDAGDAKEPFALAAGRLRDEAKNLRTVVAAAALVTAGEVRLAGDVDPAACDACVCLGRLSAAELGDQRRRALVFVAPARYEPFGLAILEAAADGCALVLGEIPSLRELWDGAAVFVDPDDARALARALDELLADPAEAQAWGGRARRRARRYSAEAMTGRYEDLYRELVPS
jgi:glycogen synthase